MPLLLNGIVMWSGALNQIPIGWSLCDGTNGTPNLQNRFIIGAGSTYNFEDTGGSVDLVLAEHGHTLSGTLSNASAISHTHSMGSGRTNSGGFSKQIGDSPNRSTPQGGAHAHAVVASTAGSGENGIGKNLPPYYSLAFIMQME